MTDSMPLDSLRVRRAILNLMRTMREDPPFPALNDEMSDDEMQAALRAWDAKRCGHLCEVEDAAYHLVRLFGFELPKHPANA